MLITSPHNETLKEIRRLTARRRERETLGRFVAEGEDLLAAAQEAGWSPLHRLVAAGSGLEGTEVTPELLAGVSGLGSGTRALGVYETRWAPAPAGPVCVYLHGVGDPGNVGTILRACEAFGASCLALGPGSADPFGPKAVRASMGAIFTVPVVRCELGDLPGTTIALDAGGHWPSTGHMSLQMDTDVSLLVGTERQGLPEGVLAAVDRVVRIPIRNHSLNAAMAATVALYELTSRDAS
ncbi:MAG TPA: RNA methyltransferase [Solirubrobacteraceae bacterium]|nr:RNA methyltransferase [Solirubrobacteraceae bacterium]